MRVDEPGIVVTTPVPLKRLIKKQYGNARNFSKELGFTESAVSHILHGRRKIYPWCEELMLKLLNISQVQFRTIIGEQK